jgi:hypothetical protein
MTVYNVLTENFKKLFHLSMKSDDRGFALAQVIFLIGLISALSVTVYRVNQKTVEQSRRINQDTAVDFTSRKMLAYLSSTQACLNTIAPLGAWNDTNNRFYEIRDPDNNVAYEACGTINTTNLALNNRCLIQTSGAGNIYLKEMRLINLNSSPTPPVLPNAEIIFSYVLLNQFYNEGTGNYELREQNISSRALLTISYDNDTNTISRCAYTDNVGLSDACSMIGGEFNAETFKCKSPSIGFAAFTAGEYGLKVDGNFRTTRRMSAQSMVVGEPIATPPTANQPGQLFVTGGVQFGTVDGGVSVGGTAGAASQSMTIAGSLHGSATTGSGTIGSLHLVEPGGATGDARRWLVTDGQMTLLNFPTTLDLSSPADANRVVTTGWVRRAVARAMADSVGDVNNIFSRLASDLTDDDSSIEDNMVKRFCESSRMREVSHTAEGGQIGGSFLAWRDGVAPNVVSPNRRRCSFAPTFLIDAHMCNGPNPSSPYCNTVYANWICLGSGADRLCRNSFPTSATLQMSECEAPSVISRDHLGGINEYFCSVDYVFVNTSTCCRMRAK